MHFINKSLNFVPYDPTDNVRMDPGNGLMLNTWQAITRNDTDLARRKILYCTKEGAFSQTRIVSLQLGSRQLKKMVSLDYIIFCRLCYI